MSADPSPLPDRDDLAFSYLEQLPYTPYPFQEEAILSWFDSDDGLLVCAPTGMGKTLIAEAGLYEALKLGRRAYYTTPLIALTEQKYREIRASAERWGFGADSVGLITGNRRENPDAPILVGEFSCILWSKGADRWIRDCIELFEEYGWSWCYHAYREWPAWDVEYTNDPDWAVGAWIKADADTARKRELLKGLSRNRRP